jgi:hypothetical protein
MNILLMEKANHILRSLKSILIYPFTNLCTDTSVNTYFPMLNLLDMMEIKPVTLFQVKKKRLEIPSSTLSKELTSTESVITDKWENWLGVPVLWLDEIIISNRTIARIQRSKTQFLSTYSPTQQIVPRGRGCRKRCNFPDHSSSVSRRVNITETRKSATKNHIENIISSRTW